MVLVSNKPSNHIVFYKLNSAMERGTKPDALGWKPCHWTRTLKAAMVNASRAWKYAQPRCMTFLKWQTKVSIDNTVSMRIRSSHLSLSRLKHRQPGVQAHPEIVQGTADLHHEIADARLPQPDPVFHNAV